MSGIQQVVLSGPLILAAPIAAAAGAITFISPCCLPLVPGYLAYVTGMSGTDAQAGPAGGRRDRSARRRAARNAGAGQDATAAASTATTASAAGGAAGGTGNVRVAVDAPPEAAEPAATGTDAAGTDAAGTAGTGRDGTGPDRPARPGRGRTVAGTLLFVLGFSVLFAVYGAASGSLGGTLLAHHQQTVIQVLGAVTIVLGLLFAGIFDRFSFAGRIIRPSVRPRAGLAGAPLLGVMFGLGWTPCIGPTLATVLALSTTTGTAGRGAFLAFIYGLGLGVPFLIVSMAFQRSMRVFSHFRRHARLVTRIGGALLVAVGVLEVSGAWASAMTWLKIHWIGGYQPML
jgi:cytochrome c-type biogenesis protein